MGFRGYWLGVSPELKVGFKITWNMKWESEESLWAKANLLFVNREGKDEQETEIVHFLGVT